MHPALSIIVFTVLSGLGYGLAFVLGARLLNPTDVATHLAFVVAFALISAGLLASTFHLRNPQRAWRALGQWRSSWLSREGVMAVLTFAPLIWVGGATFFAQTATGQEFYAGGYPFWGSLLLQMGAAVTVLCTSMIYTQLRSVDAWHTWLTPACFLAFSLAGGLLLASIFAFLSHNPVASLLSGLAMAANLLAWALKCFWRLHMKNLSPTSTPESATQLGRLGKVRQFEPPHMTGNYLTNEMMFRVGRKHGNALFAIAVFFGAALPGVLLPLALMAVSYDSYGAGLILSVLALACHLVGVFTERWLFFAEARHAVSSFYGS